MKIAALTMVYNEAVILPYFLQHYDYLNLIHVLYDIASTDNSLQILKNAPNVVIEYIHVEPGNDDIEKTDLINQAYYNMKADWIYVLDPDELIFPANESPDEFLKRQDYNAVRAAMFQVYRHRTDKDLDPLLPVIGQRIHGDPHIFSRVVGPNRDFNAHYIKPVVVRPLKNVRFEAGKHVLTGEVKMSPEYYLGAHWAMADQSIALIRRMRNKARKSDRQRRLNLGFQNANITEEWIKDECRRHLDDPLIPELVPIQDKTEAELKTLFNRSFIQKARIAELQNQIQEENSRIEQLESRLKAKEDEVLQITDSTTWRLARKISPVTKAILTPKIRRLFRRLL
jgi:hypothetical protein